MNKIQKLDQQVIQKIAAGEIVERPAHIVKELLENALDAGATHITLSVENGGKELIMIEDNGSGMSREDACLSIQHHTTSKLQKVEDLETLYTYGFRGEALSSISSVSKMIIKTRDITSSEGFLLSISGGFIESIEVVAAQIGTTIQIRDLFYNVPARKKFLKKETTELNQIKQLFFASCFQALSVYFTFINDGRMILSCPAVTTISDRFLQLEGLGSSAHLIPLIPFQRDGIILSGLISDTQYVSYDRSDIFVFVNNRWIKNTPITRALINGYAASLPPQKYPRAVLHITIDPREVDVNIHPKKEEVRFLHPRRVEQMVEEVVAQTLESKIPKAPAISFQNNTTSSPFVNQYEPMTQSKSMSSIAYIPHFEASQSSNSIEGGSTEPKYIEETIPKVVFQQSPVVITQEENEKQIDIAAQLTPIGQIFNTYILATMDTTLYIIDQHAAHERIMFERLVTGHQGLLAIKQLFPLLIPLPELQQKILLRYEHIFSSSGIVIETFDTTHLVITATPARITQHAIEDLFHETLLLIENESISCEMVEKKLLHHVRCHIACKAAIKAGDQLDTVGMLQLITDLGQVPNRFCCPHGRPTIWEITIADLEKWFKRR